MKLKNPMLVVTDIDRSVEFYKKVFGLHVIMDFGANKTLTGGLALQTADTYKDFIGTSMRSAVCSGVIPLSRKRRHTAFRFSPTSMICLSGS